MVFASRSFLIKTYLYDSEAFTYLFDIFESNFAISSLLRNELNNQHFFVIYILFLFDFFSNRTFPNFQTFKKLKSSQLKKFFKNYKNKKDYTFEHLSSFITVKERLQKIKGLSKNIKRQNDHFYKWEKIINYFFSFIKKNKLKSSKQQNFVFSYFFWILNTLSGRFKTLFFRSFSLLTANSMYRRILIFLCEILKSLYQNSKICLKY